MEIACTTPSRFGLDNSPNYSICMDKDENAKHVVFVSEIINYLRKSCLRCRQYSSSRQCNRLVTKIGYNLLRSERIHTIFSGKPKLRKVALERNRAIEAKIHCQVIPNVISAGCRMTVPFEDNTPT